MLIQIVEDDRALREGIVLALKEPGMEFVQSGCVDAAKKDFGVEIREEDTAKIFQRFYRADTLQQEEGAGIGLYLTREILRRENGYIKVKSKAGKGAEFILYLQKNTI